MALSNSQFDEIMRGYDRRQLHNQHILNERIAEAYKQLLHANYWLVIPRHYPV
jgi:hypothetical protein